MDGDLAPLREIVELKKRFGAILLLDEAHAIGVLGPHGRGLAAELGLEKEIDVQMGTLSKSSRRQRRLYLRLAQSGRLADQSRALLHFLDRAAARAGGGGGGSDSISAIPKEGDSRRKLLWRRIVQFRKLLPEGGAAFGQPSAAIIPWMVGDERRALDLARALQQESFFVPAIRYPTVAKGAARLRITISAAHSALQIASLGDALGRLAGPAKAAV